MARNPSLREQIRPWVVAHAMEGFGGKPHNQTTLRILISFLGEELAKDVKMEDSD